jgi:hypothetical protein
MAFKRGARPSPRHKLLSATPHRVLTAPPPEFAGLATQLSYWLNDEEGDCVTAEEAEAKGSYSAGYCGLADLFIPDGVVGSWADRYGFANGAALTDVMDQMQKTGFVVDGKEYKDGPYKGVDYSNESVLRSAIATGPVKIAIAADCLPSGAGNHTGWYSFGNQNNHNTDHCVGLRGYGTAAFCFKALGVPVPTGVDPAKPDCYILYTWKTYGVVDHAWIMGTCDEAWVRVPTTPGQSPSPSPAPPPPPPAPTPVPAPGGFWQTVVEVWNLVLSLLHLSKTVGAYRGLPRPRELNVGQFGLYSDATISTVNWQAIVVWIKSLIAEYGPTILPELKAWVDALTVSPLIKWALDALIAWLAQQIPTPSKRAEAINPVTILRIVMLLVSEYEKLAPIVKADLVAGKTWEQILKDCLAALV